MRQPEAIRAVIFDMDGVLTDSEPLINAAAIAMFQELGLSVQSEDFHPFVGAGEDRYLGGVAEKYRFPLDLPAAKRRTYEIYLNWVPTRLRAFPGATALVAACRQAGWRVAVASSGDRLKVEANLRQIGWPCENWDAVITGEEVVRKKPAPDIFLAAASRLGLTSGQCAVVEDAVNGVQAAKAAGMRCVAVAQTFSAEALTLAGAEVTRPGMADVALTDLSGGLVAAPPAAGPDAPAAPAVPPPTGAATRPERSWGLGATLGLGLAVVLSFLVVQSLMVGVAVGVRAALHHQALPERLENNGLLLSLSWCVATPVGVALTWMFARLRTRAPGQYLGLRPVAAKALARWSGMLVVLAALSDGLTAALGRPLVPDFMKEVYQSAGFLPLLWLVIIVVGPVMEETLFRGFLFEGIRRSRLGAPGAIWLPALLWALTHVQYDAYGVGTIFGFGLFFGWVRLRTDSLYATIVLHGLMNLIATVEAARLH